MFFYDLHDNLLGVREQTSTGQNRFEMYAHVDGAFANPTLTYQAPREAFMASAPVQDPASSGHVPVRGRFPGQWEMEGTAMQSAAGVLYDGAMRDLAHNHARVYDPGMGAYGAVEGLLSRADGATLGANALPVLGYAAGNPTIVVDPDGRLPFLVGFIAVGVGVAAATVWGWWSDGAQIREAVSREVQQNSLPGSPYGNALRHCIGSCVFARTHSSASAWWSGYAYETLTYARDPRYRTEAMARDRTVDLCNNAIGIDAADASGSCEQNCLSLWNNGTLYRDVAGAPPHRFPWQ